MRYSLKIIKPNCGTPERETFDNFTDAQSDVLHLINCAIERCTNTDEIDAWLLELATVESATPAEGFHVTVNEQTYICRELKADRATTDDVVYGSRELSDVIRFHSKIVKLEQKKAVESTETGEEV